VREQMFFGLQKKIIIIIMIKLNPTAQPKEKKKKLHVEEKKKMLTGVRISLIIERQAILSKDSGLQSRNALVNAYHHKQLFNISILVFTCLLSTRI
jgi:hypothetical protein